MSPCLKVIFLLQTLDENRNLLGSVKTELNLLQLRVAAVICFS